MTTTTERTRWLKTDPECPAARHSPSMGNYHRGCRCPQTLETLTRWARTTADPHCRARLHSGTNTAWREGCRCAGALVAHEEWKSGVRDQRRTALQAYRRTGRCGATVHGSITAYRRGCRCPEVITRFGAKYTGAAAVLRRRTGSRVINPWREGKMAVDRTNLLMLVHGLVDRPTTGERIAAFVILSKRGSEILGHLDGEQIGERIGVSAKTVGLYRKKVKELRDRRTERRLFEARAKAGRAAAAAERRAASVAAQLAGMERTAQRRAAWKRHCRTMRRLRESQARTTTSA